MFGSSSIWQPQPYREHSVKPKAKPDLSNGGNNEKLKRIRRQTMGMLSCGGGNEERQTRREDCRWRKERRLGLQDIKEFEEAMIMAVLRTETKVLDKKRLKVFQDITSSSLSPRA
ncbi:hypothetical protein Bca4012_080887 [Brassica carinata]